MKTILIIDDEATIVAMLKKLFERAEFSVLTANDGEKGIELTIQNEIDLVITDIVMPEKEGISVILELKQIRPNCKIIAMSGGGFIDPHDYLESAQEMGAHAVFRKPFETRELLEKVRELLS